MQVGIYKLMLPKVVKHNGTHELFMNMYVVVSQRYYYIDVIIKKFSHYKCFTEIEGPYGVKIETEKSA